MNGFASNVERHCRELLSPLLPHARFLAGRRRRGAGDVLLAWRYHDSVKEGAPLRPCLYRVATNACLESMSVVWFPAWSETFQ